MARKRRSFPIKISKNYSKRDVQEAVFLDLVHKHPRGPKGVLEKTEYRLYDTDPQLIERTKGTVCGYNSIDLYRMVQEIQKSSADDRGYRVNGRGTDEYDYRNLVRALWPNVGERGVTRRSRRIASRVGKAVNYILRNGIPGIWNVQWGYNDLSRATVAANNEVDAINQAKIFFGPFINEDWRLSANFIREGSKLELMDSNKPMIEAVEERKNRCRAKIKELQDEIEKFDCLKSLVEVYSVSCLEA